MLSEHITPDMIRLQVPADNWEDAVRAGGNLLVEAGICKPRYVDAMVKAVLDMGPYMVLAPGIALAHSRPEDGMIKPGISIVNLKSPVEFGSEANDPVSLVISFGGINNDSHMEMLKELANFLMEEDNQKLLKTSSDVQEIMRAFS
jgi:mannitol/fructose-specific phosphotransferase system IIA component (Ntr-type)